MKRIIWMIGLLIVLVIFYASMSKPKTTHKLTDVEYTSSYKISEPKKKELKIVDGWTFKFSKNYMYVKGSVENVGNSDISYYKIRVRYLDENNKVIDSDWTNGSNVKIEEQQKFEIITERDNRIKKCSLNLEEIR